ncbi:2-phosphosulfolactate phosphatase [Piscibacillus salipiscarius]|uniref:2-phosphosulfolactate phosphatase n=1 Tax=Piscibacillus salipiscarius TaxID=299480 RepID=UPI0034E2A0E0
MKTDHTDQTIVIVCAGSGGVFNIEDFYGAGHLLSELLAETSYDLTDSAFAALTFYEGLKDQPTQVLQKSSVGRMLSKHQLDHVLEFVAQKSIRSRA